MKNLCLIGLVLLCALSAGAQTGSKKDSTANPPTLSDLRPAVNIKPISLSDAGANVA
ncbi:MAG: hypothetical protein JSU01_03200 [Bacteroidetes bacterium]|nr:hypothetical protein [Bacteroidota bacterium]